MAAPEVKKEPIGDRALTLAEETDRQLVGLQPEDAAELTPEDLEDLANYAAAISTNLVGH